MRRAYHTYIIFGLLELRYDISSVCTGYGSSLIREQASISTCGTLTAILSCAARDASDLVQQLLVFNPARRLSAERALHHEYVAKFHREKDEPILLSDVLLPLRDDKQVSVDDYRNKLYSIMAKGFQNCNQPRKTQSSKSQTLTTKSKSFQEAETKIYSKSKHSVSADQKLRKPKPLERPIKEYKSDQCIKPMKATKIFEGKSQNWLECGDYYQKTGYSDMEYNKNVYNMEKKNLQQRRNSTSFSNMSIGDGSFYGERHGVITASALMDLRTSMR